MAKQKVIEYDDSINEDFSKVQIKGRTIDENYKYLHYGFLYNFICCIFYNIIAKPIIWVFTKIVYHHKIKNKKVLKKHKKDGYFIYGNHTLHAGDAYIPTVLNMTKTTHIITGPASVSVPIIKTITPMLGAIPLPSNIKSTRQFLNALEKRILQHRVIAIYPEATIWPSTTIIRNFKDGSFKYPIMFNTPVYCFTNTYHKKRFGKRPKVVTFVDGPFYVNKNLATVKEQQKDLRDRVFEAMSERSKLNTYEYIKYVKK